MSTNLNPIRNLSVIEARNRIGIGNTKFWQLVAAGEIKVRKIGRRTFVLEQDCDDFIQNRPSIYFSNPQSK